jgi:hypothetical protein
MGSRKRCAERFPWLQSEYGLRLAHHFLSCHCIMNQNESQFGKSELSQ